MSGSASTGAARRFWWVGTGLTGYLGFRPAFNRPSLYAGAGVAAAAWLVYEFFRLAGVTAARPTGNLSNVVFLLAVWQFLCFMGTRFHADPFQDPPGPLLPYSATHRLVFWSSMVVVPIALALAPAYMGVLRGWPGLRAGAVVWALAADTAALATLALGVDVCRWLFRTHAPLPLRRLSSLLTIGIANVLVVGAGVLCFAVALQFGGRRVFVSSGVTALMHQIGQAPNAAPLRDAVGQHVQRWQAFDDISTFSTLVTQGQAPSIADLLLRGAALGGVLLLVGVFPGRRPEEQGPITRFAFQARAWVTDATLCICPRGLRVAGRLMLPALYRATRGAAAAGLVLMITAFFLTWGRVTGGGPPGAVDRVLVSSGALLALLLALVLVPIADGLGLRPADYIRYVTLPGSTRQLLRRMVLLALAGAAVLNLVVAITWALVVQPDAAVALAFAAGVACLQVAALGVYLSLITSWWPMWRRIGPWFALAWIIIPASILIWQFGMLRAHPQSLASLAGIEVVASLLGAGAAWLAIGRMVGTREPIAGI